HQPLQARRGAGLERAEAAVPAAPAAVAPGPATRAAEARVAVAPTAAGCAAVPAAAAVPAPTAGAAVASTVAGPQAAAIAGVDSFLGPEALLRLGAPAHLAQILSARRPIAEHHVRLVAARAQVDMSLPHGREPGRVVKHVGVVLIAQ